MAAVTIHSDFGAQKYSRHSINICLLIEWMTRPCPYGVPLPSCVHLCNPMDCSTPGLSVPHHLPKFAQVHVCCISDAIQPSHPLTPLLLLLSIFPSIRDFPNESAVHIRWPKYWSFSFSISPSGNIQGWCPLRLAGLISLLPRDSQESSPAPWFEGINSLAFCLLYGPALTTVCDHQEDHSLDYMDFCWESNISAFQHTV